jgi:hypothetical protein
MIKTYISTVHYLQNKINLKIVKRDPIVDEKR